MFAMLHQSIKRLPKHVYRCDQLVDVEAVASRLQRCDGLLGQPDLNYIKSLNPYHRANKYMNKHLFLIVYF